MPRGRAATASYREGYTDEELVRLPAILTVKEVSKVLRCSTSKVASMAQFGEIPGYKIRNQWRFKRDEILGCIGQDMDDLRSSVSRKKLIDEQTRCQLDEMFRQSVESDVLIGAPTTSGAPEADVNASVLKVLSSLLGKASPSVVAELLGSVEPMRHPGLL